MARSGLLVPAKYIDGVPPSSSAKSAFDPGAERQKIMSRIPELGAFKIFGQRVLVAKFVRDRLSANLEVSGKTQNEDKWQGKIGLVLAMGHLAFKSDANNNFGPDTVKVGDWVLYSYGDGYDTDYQPPGTFEKIACKIINDVLIAGVVTRPDMFY